MSNYIELLREWKETELLPAILRNPAIAFPEMGFTRRGDKWISNKHLFGEPSKSGSKDQCYITPKYGYTIGDNSGSKRSFIDYVRERDHCDLTTAERTLAKAVGIAYPECELTAEEQAQREQRRAKDANRITANDVFTSALFSGPKGANDVLSYLYGRGWTEDEIKRGELGYIDEAIKAGLPDVADIASPAIGTTHKLVIPLRGMNGNLFGFKFRTIQNIAGVSKYINSAGAEIGGNFFGYLIGEEAVVVEGELDALHARLRGAHNVIATMGGGVKQRAVENAIKARTRRFTLLFDMDERGQGFVAPSIETIERAGGEAWIAELPNGVKDLDEFFTAGYSLDDYQAMIATAKPAYEWKLKQVAKKYISLEDENQAKGIFDTPAMTMKQREDFFADVRAIMNAPAMKSENRQLFKESLRGYEDALHFSVEDFVISADNEYYRQQEAQRANELTKASEAIQGAIKAGDYERASRLMADAGATYKAQNKAQTFAEEFRHECRGLTELLSGIKAGIPTGYVFKGKDQILGEYAEHFELNVGLAFICAPTSHGKTSFLNNLAMNIAHYNRHRNNGQSVLYFSYEIDRARLMANLLNTFVGDADLNKIDKPLNAIYDEAKGNGSRFFKTVDKYNTYLNKKRAFENLIKSGDICVSDTAHKAGELIDAIRYYTKNVKRPTAVLIDYAQLIYDEDARGLSRTEELKKIVNAIKELSKELQLPIVLSAQMKNDVTSPLDVTIDNIGESKDLAMIADTAIGLFNLSKLHSLSENSTEKKLIRFLLRLEGAEKLKGLKLDEKSNGNIHPIRGKMYAKIIKRRFGLSDIEEVFDYEARTGTITPNNPDALKRSYTEQELFDEDEERTLKY